tara:strand:+ start:140 stop:487 length:348 start_codon:yes stop_codon:yes gene_type:complete
MVGHVFEEAESGLYFSDDSPNIRPEVSGVIFPFPTACVGKWLARVSASDAIHFSMPRLAIKGGSITPNRSIVEITFLNTGERDSDGEGFPLHVTACASGWLGEFESEFDASDPTT